ncbi:MAG: 3-isopropylmalate dehydrogenase [Bacteroidales bacterium]|nr:3-isopropylmalate dehydrogenase [Bacteroidales bacterium]MCB9028435.1 3-isopropylmalate dehydrogenase [Bacteroidales bacterium]MDD3736636.1 3-isopropylmalate dehydrogenase [Bacteroidales bacterium]HNT94384.1 3-isopropylmalate dehydrogenase [Bacteroidales bacterium]HOO67500.1 3-isopropylmalate dehydrogenase [Bacteroidales bacterium]
MNYNIALLPGDGIGPEVIEQAVKVLKVTGEVTGHTFSFTEGLVGAVAIDHSGNPFPDETLDLCRRSDAILFGAIGHPRYDNDPSAKVRPEQGLLRMRSELGLYANVRPVKSIPALAGMSPLKEEIVAGTDIVMVRELTGGIYFGKPRGRSEDGLTAYDTCTYSRSEIERVVHLGCRYARQRRKKVTVIDKANVLATSRLWRETAKEIAGEYPDVEMDFMFVDNAAMQLVRNPSAFDVIVTENMFGDILSDEASMITGSLGMLPSASIGLSTSLYEPIHGSFPQAAGKNIANPVGTILSAAMMLDLSFGLAKEAEMITVAVEETVKEGYVTADLDDRNPCSTTVAGERICSRLREFSV